MTKMDLLKAFREAASWDLADIPTNEEKIDHTFSSEFIKNMRKLIQSEKHYYWTLVNSTKKRIIVIAAVIAILFTTVFSVGAIREPIVNFIIETYETFTHYLFGGDTSDKIEYEYEYKFKAIPQGFEDIGGQRNDAAIFKSYQNKNGDIIELNQSITDQTELFVDAEHGDVLRKKLGDMDVQIQITAQYAQAIWIKDTYLLTLTYHGKTDIETMMELIKLIE